MNRLAAKRIAGLATVWLTFFSGGEKASFHQFTQSFINGYQRLRIPEWSYDYREYLGSIPPAQAIEQQRLFFEGMAGQLAGFSRSSLPPADRITYDQIRWELQLNAERARLEGIWSAAGRPAPEGGLSKLPHAREWVALYIQHYTGTTITPEEVTALGRQEVARCQQEIRDIRNRLSPGDSAGFYRQLRNDRFVLTDIDRIIAAFHRTDSIVRSHLAEFVGPAAIPAVIAQEWAHAGPNTPPGAYFRADDDAGGRPVFRFSFYGRRFSRRALEWLYLHEAIPGHHLQASWPVRADGLQGLFRYPGNFEGWGCHVEYFGKDLGLYGDPYSELGKWEWDLVRSTRLVLDIGIHYHGWTAEQALDYWHSAVPGQEEIAAREIRRVTAWPGQALSYKVGATAIFRLQEDWLAAHPGQTPARFRRWFLSLGSLPLAVIGGLVQHA